MKRSTVKLCTLNYQHSIKNRKWTHSIPYLSKLFGSFAFSFTFICRKSHFPRESQSQKKNLVEIWQKTMQTNQRWNFCFVYMNHHCLNIDQTNHDHIFCTHKSLTFNQNVIDPCLYFPIFHRCEYKIRLRTFDSLLRNVYTMLN